MNGDDATAARARRALVVFGVVSLVGVLFLSVGVGSVAAQSSGEDTIGIDTTSTELTEELNKTYVGMESDRANSVVQTDDGGFAIAGTTSSFGSGGVFGSDAWLIKTDANGNVEFSRTFGGSDFDWANSVVQTSDGGYAIAGETQSFGNKAWLIKTDGSGNEEFNKTYSRPGIGSSQARSVIQTSDGGFALAGRTGDAFGKDAWLIKTDTNGNEEFNETYGGSETDEARSVVQTDEGGYALAGGTGTFGPFSETSLGSGSRNAWLIRTDTNGNEQFNKTYGGSGFENANSVVETSDGFAIGGYTTSFGSGLNDTWLIKTNSNGNEEFNETYGGSEVDEANSIVQTSDGGFALAGETLSFGSGKDDMWLMKTDGNGNIEINETYGGSDFDKARSVVQTVDGGFALAGDTWSFGSGSSDAWLIKTTVPDPSIDDSSFRIDPYPVEKGGTPEVSVNVTNADNVQIKVNGEKKDMQNTGGNTWTREISSSVNDERGKRVNLEITAGDDTLSDVTDAYPRTQLPADPGTVPPTEQIHYYVFDDVEDVPVVLAKFENQNVSDFGFGPAENVTQWERAREYDINTYMGSGRGSSGSIGFDFTYYDNGTEFYTVEQETTYDNRALCRTPPAWHRGFAVDARNEVTSIGQNERWVATHLGEGGRASVVPQDFCDDSNPARAYMNMGTMGTIGGADQYGIWLEELSHLYLNMGDLYEPRKKRSTAVNGGLGAGDPLTGLMGSGDNNQYSTDDGQIVNNRLPQPYSVISRTKLNDIGLGNQADPNWPWASLDTRALVGDTTVEVERVSKVGVGDSVLVIKTGVFGEQDSLFDTNGTIEYLFEAHVDENKVRGYKITQTGIITKELDTAVTVAGSIDGKKSYLKDGLFAEFSVDSTSEPFEVTASYNSKSNSKLAALAGSINTQSGQTVSEAPDVTTPNLDLRAVDSQGRVTGITENGNFVNEIPGAEASGDTTGVEWITVPDDADVEFEVSSDDVQKFIDETNVSEENVTANYSTSVTSYGSNTTIEQEDGEPMVTNTTTKTVTENESIDPGQTENAVNETVIAGFSRSPREASPGEKVRFNASISTNLDGTIQTYEWDLDNDGQKEETGLTANRSYSTTGNYTVELTVTGDGGAKDTTTVNVTVTEDIISLSPVGDFENPPQDLEGDGLYRDINGDGSSNLGDVIALYENYEDDSVLNNNPELFNFNNQENPDDVTLGDVIALYDGV